MLSICGHTEDPGGKQRREVALLQCKSRLKRVVSIGGHTEAPGGKQRREVAPLPFELVVLEVALGDVCSVVARMARDLELQSGPALEALTSDVRANRIMQSIPSKLAKLLRLD